VPVTVCDLPPGTSEWNQLEHHPFSFITQNWRGKPLVSYQTIVQLIAAPTTRTDLNVKCEMGHTSQPAGIKVCDSERSG
jgi:hypothetical protein